MTPEELLDIFPELPRQEDGPPDACRFDLVENEADKRLARDARHDL